MALIRFNFNKDFPKEEQDKILTQMNSEKSWPPIEEAGRLHPNSDDPEMYSQCYFRFTEARSSRARRNEVLTQYLFTMNEIRKKQYEKAWIVEEEPESDEPDTHGFLWTA